MSKIKCIIVEDEPLAAKVLSDYISQVPFLQLQATCKDAILATDYLRDNTTDLIFLDIHLPKLKGLAFLKTLSLYPKAQSLKLKVSILFVSIFIASNSQKTSFNSTP